MRLYILSIFLFFTTLNSYAQEPISFQAAEKKLFTIYSKINRFASEVDNIEHNTLFISLLDSILRIPESFEYPFSTLQIGNVYPHDKSFRIISWNMIHDDGKYENFGFIQKYDKENHKILLFPLKDNAKATKTPMLQVCTNEGWIGATYYMVCQNRYDGETYYTLLGWNPHSIYTQKKVIETLKFDKTGAPVFGYPIVELKSKGFQRRLIYEYSAKSSMMLRYDKKKKMIVLDHLAPSDYRYTDIYEFYGPDFSVDGYKFKRGKWRYVSDIDIRNPRERLVEFVPIQILRLFPSKESDVVR